MLSGILRERGVETGGFVASLRFYARIGVAQGYERCDATFKLLAQQVPMQDERSAAAVTDAEVGCARGEA